MESYIRAEIFSSPKHNKKLTAFFKAVHDYDEANMVKCCESFEVETFSVLELLLNDPIFSDYLEELTVSFLKNKIKIDAICGSSGFDFLIEILKLIGPNSKEILATYKHDEEPPDDGDWPIKILYKNNSIFL
jgi:hypothetical protein